MRTGTEKKTSERFLIRFLIRGMSAICPHVGEGWNQTCRERGGMKHVREGWN